MEDKERVIEVNSKIMDFISVRFGSLSDNFVSFLFDLNQYLDRLKVDRYFDEFHYFICGLVVRCCSTCLSDNQ